MCVDSGAAGPRISFLVATRYNLILHERRTYVNHVVRVYTRDGSRHFYKYDALETKFRGIGRNVVLL